MAAKKVTITLDEEQLYRVRRLVVTGEARSVAGFVRHAVAASLDDVADWSLLLAHGLRNTDRSGGSPRSGYARAPTTRSNMRGHSLLCSRSVVLSYRADSRSIA
jgi:Arc/MetJ-type ribon-helix-helix transcriptional regulator